MSQSLGIIIVDKSGTLKALNVKDYKEEDLYKKCGFKKSDGFEKQTEWSSKIDGQRYLTSLYAKTDGKANSENKYDFPLPLTQNYFSDLALSSRILRRKMLLTLSAISQFLYGKKFTKSYLAVSRT